MVLTARDIMDPQVLTVVSTADAFTSAQTLVANRKGYAVVLRPDGTLAGIVTEWDFVAKVLAEARDPKSLAIGEIASALTHTCTPETPAEDVIQEMATAAVRRMPVVAGGKVVGIITSRDVLGMFREYVDKLSAQIAGYHSDPTPLG
jgi:CBS domain-containing protein